MKKKILLSVALLLGVGGLGAVGLLVAVLQDLPRMDGMKDYHPPVLTRVYDRNGELIARFFKERRTIVAREQMPDRLVKAFLAAEDAEFYTHKGVDPMGVVAAVVQEVAHKLVGAKRRGGSTITQQTAKTFLLSSEQTYARKLREMALAYEIENAFSKDEILFLYLNQIYFGNGAYGVEEAAQTYFGKHVGELTLAECAVLASIPKSPNVINPIHNPNRTLQRRAYVLGQMKEHGFAPADEIDAAQKAPLFREKPPPEYLNRSPWYAEEVRRYLVDKYGEEAVFTQGLVVYTAVDAKMDVAAQKALQEGLIDVDQRRGWRGPLMRLDPDVTKGFIEAVRRELEERLPKDADERALRVWDLSTVDEGTVKHNIEEAALRVRLAYRDVGALVGGVVEEVDNTKDVVTVDLGTVRGTLGLADMRWARTRKMGEVGPAPKHPGDVLKAGDVILVRILKEAPAPGNTTHPVLALEQFPQVQGALVSVEPETRRVRSLVGGYDFARSSFNRATQAHRQPGSSFKPFIYAAAIKSRNFTPASIIVDAPKVFAMPDGKDWKPENSDGKFRGDIRLRECLTNSVNICSITLVETLLPENVVSVAQKVGLGASWPKNLTLALGTGDVTPLALANAYATFAAEGQYAEPIMIEKVKTVDGKVLEENNVTMTEVFDPATAYVTLSLMKSVVEAGTAKRIKELGRPVAGKTGTTSGPVDTWFVGCLPGLCTAVWVGLDKNEPLPPSEFGGRAAAPIFLDYHKVILEGTPVRDFEMPAGVEKKLIDPKSGLLAREGQKDAIEEVFLEGTAPTEVADPESEGRPAEWREEEP